MEDERHLILLTALLPLLFWTGCTMTPLPDCGEILQSSPPPVFDDPWTLYENTAPPSVSAGQSNANALAYKNEPAPSVSAGQSNANAPAYKDEPAPSVSAGQSDEASPRIDLEALEAALSSDLWVKNLELPRWIENGMKDPNAYRDVDKMRRLTEIYRLNMSAEELKKKKNVFEYSPGLLSTWRWYHKDIEQLSTIPTVRRANPANFFRDEKYADKRFDVLRANAVILLARDGDYLSAEYLYRIIGDRELRVELRCAAVEALSALPNVVEADLVPLIEEAREKETETVNPRTGLPEKKSRSAIVLLWTEILTAIARRVDPWEHPCFLEPLNSRSGNMRLEAARIWRRSPPSEEFVEAGRRLPPAYLDFARKETEPTIRVEIIRTLGAWRDPEILDFVRSDLNQSGLLRDAALDALAEAGCTDAVPLIKDKLRDTVGRNRAKALEALRKLGCLDEVFRHENDKDRSVRIQVALAIADRRTPQTKDLAAKYLSDAESVQRAVIRAISTWPHEESAELLLDALRSDVLNVRVSAAESLSRFVPEAKTYPATAMPKTQLEQHAALARRVRQTLEIAPPQAPENGSTEITNENDVPDERLLVEIRRCLDQWNRPEKTRDERDAVRQRLIGLGNRLAPAVEYLHDIERRTIPESFDDILAEVDPLFETIRRLDSDDVGQRRKAAGELNHRGLRHETSKLAANRILRCALEENDYHVSVALLETLRQADHDAARLLARRLLESEKPELRRRCCEVLRDFGDLSDLEALAALLRNSNRSLVRAALEAIVAIFETAPEDVPEERDAIAETLIGMLLQGDAYLQTDLAAALHTLGYSEGEETLRRLSLASESKVRLYVARTIVSLEDPVFEPVLTRFLDDNASIRSIAQNALSDK